MSGISFDKYCGGQGLTAEIFQAAYNISPQELEQYTIAIRLAKTMRPKGLFWELVAIVDRWAPVRIGMFGYAEAEVLRTIQSIKNAAVSKGRPQGVWPQLPPFTKDGRYTGRLIQETPEARAARELRSRAREQKDREEQERLLRETQERQAKAKQARAKEQADCKCLWDSIPEPLKARLQQVKIEAPGHWDNISLLPKHFQDFLQECGKKLPMLKAIAQHQTQEQFHAWVHNMVTVIEHAIAAPSPATEATRTILGLIAATPKYGLQTYARWLGDSQAKVLEQKKLDQNFRGKLANFSVAHIVGEIEMLMEHDWIARITVGSHHLPVLVITSDGRRVLDCLHCRDQPVATTIGQPATAGDLSQAENAVAPKPKPDLKPVLSHIQSGYARLLQAVEADQRDAWVDFLDEPLQIAEIEHWEAGQVETMRQALQKHMPNWQVLAQWELVQHPIKYKPLKRLLPQE